MSKQRHRARAAQAPRRHRVRILGYLAGIIGTIVAAVSLLSALRPANAQAGIGDHLPGPAGDVVKIGEGIGDVITGGENPVTKFIGGTVGKMATDALGAILHQLFGKIPAKLTSGVLDGLLELPDLSNGGHVQTLSQMVQVVALGLLSAVLTVTFIRFMLVGMGPGGTGYEPLQAFFRVGLATIAVLLWPALFSVLIHLEQALINALWNNHVVQGDLAQLYEITFAFNAAGGGFAWFISILIAIAMATLMVLLVILKIVLTAATVFLFIAMPIALMLWPIPELDWLVKAATRTMTVLLLIPVLWTILFASCAAIGIDVLTFQGGGNFIDKALVKPLVLVALLYVAFTLPKYLIRMAAMGAPTPGGGFVSRAGSYMVARQAGQAMQSYIPQWAGGGRGGDGPQMSATASFRQGGVTQAARFSGPGAAAQAAQFSREQGWDASSNESGGGRAQRQGGESAGEGGKQAAGQGKGAAAGQGQGQGQGQAGGQRQRPETAERAASDGLLARSSRFSRAAMDKEEAAIQAAAGSGGAQGAQQAMGALTPQMREEVADKAVTANNDGQFAKQMAYQAANRDYTSAEANAFRALGAHALAHGRMSVADAASSPIADSAGAAGSSGTSSASGAPMTDVPMGGSASPQPAPANGNGNGSGGNGSSNGGGNGSSNGGKAAPRSIPDPPPGYVPSPSSDSQTPSSQPQTRPDPPMRQP